MSFENKFMFKPTLKSPGIGYAYDDSQHCYGLTPHSEDLMKEGSGLSKPVDGAVNGVVERSSLAG